MSAAPDIDVTYLVSRLAELTASIAETNLEVESLKAELRKLPLGDYDVLGRPALRLISNRRFDVDSAILLVPEDRRADVLKVSADPALIRKVLTPEQVETCMVTAGQPKVVLL